MMTHNAYKAFKEQNKSLIQAAKNSDNLIIKAHAQQVLAAEAYNAGLESKSVKWDLRYYRTMVQAQAALNKNLTRQVESKLDRFLR